MRWRVQRFCWTKNRTMKAEDDVYVYECVYDGRKWMATIRRKLDNKMYISGKDKLYFMSDTDVKRWCGGVDKDVLFN